MISAQDMLDASTATLGKCELFIACAAVADYRPAKAADQKIKKDNDSMHIDLVRNPDIVSTVANHSERPVTVGFAAETQDLMRYARGKLERKNLELIIANDVSNSAIGFNANDNAVTAIWKDGQCDIPQMGKNQLAAQLITLIAQKFFAETR